MMIQTSGRAAGKTIRDALDLYASIHRAKKGARFLVMTLYDQRLLTLTKVKKHQTKKKREAV